MLLYTNQDSYYNDEESAKYFFSLLFKMIQMVDMKNEICTEWLDRKSFSGKVLKAYGKYCQQLFNNDINDMLEEELKTFILKQYF